MYSLLVNCRVLFELRVNLLSAIKMGSVARIRPSRLESSDTLKYRASISQAWHSTEGCV